jgi:CheY-like chemotaxis protein
MQTDLYNKRIFIIEDNLPNQTITQMLLTTSGAIVAYDRWGLDAIKRMQEFAPIDLVLLDLMFPDNITGYEVFDQIRQATEFQEVPIVAVSASDPSEALPRTQAKGFAGFIRKPVDFIKFPEQIQKILSGEPVWERR